MLSMESASREKEQKEKEETNMEREGEAEKHIVFNAPFIRAQAGILVLRNPSNSKVAYKIKTNRKQRLNALPPHGYVSPREKKRIVVVCDPFEESHLAEANPPDRVTVVLTTVPTHITPPERAGQLWNHDNAHYPTRTRRIPFTVLYCTDNDPHRTHATLTHTPHKDSPRNKSQVKAEKGTAAHTPPMSQRNKLS